jgi:predicted enzyme related to lactoylglutathione lyase
VPDATAAVAKAVSLGGRELVAPFEDRHGGKIAVVADPLGAAIGLMEWVETPSNQGDAK